MGKLVAALKLLGGSMCSGSSIDHTEGGMGARRLIRGKPKDLSEFDAYTFCPPEPRDDSSNGATNTDTDLAMSDDGEHETFSQHESAGGEARERASDKRTGQPCASGRAIPQRPRKAEGRERLPLTAQSDTLQRDNNGSIVLEGSYVNNQSSSAEMRQQIMAFKDVLKARSPG